MFDASAGQIEFWIDACYRDPVSAGPAYFDYIRVFPADDASAADRLFRALAERIPFSPTLADARSTLSYPAGTSHKFMTADERREYGIGDGLVRLSVGLEHGADLERELALALAQLAG